MKNKEKILNFIYESKNAGLSSGQIAKGVGINHIQTIALLKKLREEAKPRLWFVTAYVKNNKRILYYKNKPKKMPCTTSKFDEFKELILSKEWSVVNDVSRTIGVGIQTGKKYAEEIEKEGLGNISLSYGYPYVFVRKTPQ